MFKLSTLCLVTSLIFFSPAVGALGQDSRGSAATSPPSTELGQRHEQDGDPGRALAAFELARWHDPRNAGVRAEIERLRTMLGAPDEADGWRAPFRLLTIREWSFVLLAAAAGLGGLALARGLRKTRGSERLVAQVGRSLARRRARVLGHRPHPAIPASR